jgi:hypothetical protein
MSAEKRSVHTDALATLGNIIDETQKRDAIHLAVEPVIAATNLYPAQHVGIENGKATPFAAKKLGIVDPFLTGMVPEGQRFWLIVYPRQITSLRHVWAHPDFPETISEKPTPTDPVEISKQWINDFADRIYQHPKALMDAAERWLDSEDYTYDNSESYKSHYDEFPEFWRHFKVVTGRGPKDESETFFTCSC